MYRILHCLNQDQGTVVEDDRRGTLASIRTVLIISLSVTAQKGTQARIIEAAAEAGVEWIMPNE